jgi:hypothetical protein
LIKETKKGTKNKKKKYNGWGNKSIPFILSGMRDALPVTKTHKNVKYK